MRKGFSLVELSIVLVILGLLVGGILAGRSLIRASELRSVGTEYAQYRTAVASFRDKYFALPGDMTNATNFWGPAANCPGTNADTTAAVVATCNGNGDDVLRPNAVTANEWFRFWQHLANAGMVEGSYIGVADRASYNGEAATIGWNVPASKLANAGWSAGRANDRDITDTSYFEGTYGNLLVFGAKNAVTWSSAAVLTPAEAWNIDTKLDDGKPGTGRAFVPENRANSCHDQSTSTTVPLAEIANYLLTNTNIACPLFFRRSF